MLELELPETLEDIVVWKLEYAPLIIHPVSFFDHVLFHTTLRFSGARLGENIHAWLKRIVAFEGIVSFDTAASMSIRDDLKRYNRVSVAGIFVCVLTPPQVADLLGKTHEPT
jgi:hypothetical protein